MKRTTMRVTAGGQVSLPAEVRHRWGVSRVAVIDEGDRVVLVPVPDDPISAALGSLAGPGPTTDQMRARTRSEEERIERRRARR